MLGCLCQRYYGFREVARRKPGPFKGKGANTYGPLIALLET